MPFIPLDPVGLPGLAAFAIGILGGLIALLLARRRGRNGPTSADSERRNASIVWIVVQGLGIGLAGFGPIHVALDPLSLKALIEAGVVAALMLAAVWLFDSASRAMGRNWALVARTRSDGQLVETGPFALIRNPIYVSLACLMVAMAIAYGHTANLLVAVPIFAVGTWMRVRHEEVVLRAAFGPAFDRYAARVKRFVPGVL
ncbi:methyltransferase family protein [Sphingomonas sp. PAMC 26605]|uniref:methyltransferase family protein n=1 Tax=Sphingomonas sp. PAMC 26605 TaxID=1112214 RepID=UPI00026CD781|nr:isoprenylcysteine carboxylmethyltransferase family protein [Sphingomonas sp. PAMC 26605]